MDYFIKEVEDIVSASNSYIEVFAESSIGLIDSTNKLHTLESKLFLEEGKGDSNIVSRLKTNLKALFSKVTDLIVNLFTKLKSSTKRRKVEAMGKKLDKMSKLGIDLGKIRLRIPNIIEYDSFVYTVLKKYVDKFELTGYNAILGATSTPYNEIETLTKSIEDMTSRLSSDSFTSNDIEKVLSSVYAEYPDLAYNYRITPGANLKTIERTRTAPGMYKESVSALATVGAAYYGATTVISYTLKAITTYADMKKFDANAPSKIKIEEVTVSSLYRRTMNMKLDAQENRLKKIVNNAASSVTKDMTLQEFSSGTHSNQDLIEQARDICKLINAYAKFELAELNYYYDILIEIDSKLSIKNAKQAEDAIIVNKE